MEMTPGRSSLFPMRGALVEYSGQFLGPIPNLVIFQFNPESISRTITVPGSSTEDNSAANRPNCARACRCPPALNLAALATDSLS